MSKRLQVLFDERELSELSAIAEKHGMTVSEWVRQAIRTARRREAEGDVTKKLAVLRTAMTHTFPAPDIDQMLAETERGYLAQPE